jgi:transposase
MLPTGLRILVCTEPQDMRRSFDKLAQVAREILGEEPQSGALYVFVGKSATRVKVLWWDRNGYCLLYKRLHRALFRMPADAPRVGAAMQIDGEALSALLAGVEKKSTEKLKKVH